MAVAAQTGFAAYGLGKSLAQRNADILDSVVIINVGVAFTVHVQVNQTMAGDLVQHVVQKGHAAVERVTAGAVQVNGHADAGFHWYCG